jgi:DNA repair protein RadC
MAKMKDRYKQDRPREKLASRGPNALSDYELLMAAIGSGNKQADVTKIARDVKILVAKKGGAITYKDLLEITSLGPAKAANLMASYEFWRRQFEVSERPIIDSPEKAVAQLADIRDKKQEYFVAITLDGANRLIAKRIITIGILTSSLVHPREVFAEAVPDRAASIIVAHNHPSGNLEPSEADKSVTRRLIEAGKVLGINFIDHLIITKDAFLRIQLS